MIAEEDDVANEDAEEDFDVGMRHHAMEYDSADRDNDGQLDFGEFCKLMAEREVGTPNIEELRKRFDLLDTTRDGRVQMHEYLRYALRDALARSSSRVVELLTEWDTDNSGSIDRREFRRAVRALGFTANDEEVDLLFDDFDEDESGTIEYRELNKKMRQASGVEVEQRHKLRRKAGGRKGSALSTSVAIDFVAGDTAHTQAQLRKVLSQNAVRIIDLFRDWDEDGEPKPKPKPKPEPKASPYSGRGGYAAHTPRDRLRRVQQREKRQAEEAAERGGGGAAAAAAVAALRSSQPVDFNPFQPVPPPSQPFSTRFNPLCAHAHFCPAVRDRERADRQARVRQGDADSHEPAHQVQRERGRLRSPIRELRQGWFGRDRLQRDEQAPKVRWLRSRFRHRASRFQ